MERSIETIVSAFVAGAQESKCTLRLPAGKAINAKGKDTTLWITLRLDGGFASIQDALEALAKIPTVRVGLPKRTEGVVELRVSPLLTGERAASLFAHFGGLKLRGVSAEKQKEHLTACNVQLEETSAEQPKGKRNRKTIDVGSAASEAHAAESNGHTVLS